MAEPLEGRSLLSTAGSPDFTYGIGAATVSTGGPSLDTQGLAKVSFDPQAAATTASFTTGEARQSDGKLVVVGYLYTYQTLTSDTIALARLNTDGSLDTTFGTGGVALLPAATGFNTGQAVAVQSNGDIVVAADLAPGTTDSNSGVAVYRVTSAGSLDTTFGTGGSTGFSFLNGATALFSKATTLAIGPDGNIVVGGYGNDSPNGFLPALARLTPSGSLDSTFGTSGQVLPTFANADPPQSTILGSELGVDGLAVLANNSIVFDTSVNQPGTTNLNVGQIAVGKLTPSGSYDTTFGTGGQVLLGGTEGAGPLAVQADGKLVVTGTHQAVANSIVTTHFDVFRLATDGTLDATFGAMGEATPNTINSSLSSGGGFDLLGSVLIEPDGTILLGAQAAVVAPAFSQEVFAFKPVVFAVNADGSPDIHFGPGGETILPVDWFGLTPVLGMTLQSDGKLLLVANDGVGRLLARGATGDFSEDGITDPAVLMPNFIAPLFAYRPSSGGPDVLNFFGTPGAGNTLPAPGDYDGSGIDEEAVYLPALAAFGIRPYGSNGPQDKLVSIGATGAGNSIPVPADYAGLGYTQVGVYEPATATWVYSTANSSTPSTDVTVAFGKPGAGNSIPVPADYTGSGHDEIAVYLPDIASFVYRPAGTDGSHDTAVAFGAPGAGQSIPVPGDYDGSGHTELAVYLPAIAAFAYRPYGTTGQSDHIIPFGIPGAGNSIPAPGDYDGSGHTELAVYLPGLDALAYRPYGTTGSADKFIYFGAPGAGNTVPFDAQGAAYLQGENNGGGGPGFSPKVAAWVDFVPTVAGLARKAQNGVTPSIAAIGQT